jgi:hypothetical protein
MKFKIVRGIKEICKEIARGDHGEFCEIKNCKGTEGNFVKLKNCKRGPNSSFKTRPITKTSHFHQLKLPCKNSIPTYVPLRAPFSRDKTQ